MHCSHRHSEDNQPHDYQNQSQGRPDELNALDANAFPVARVAVTNAVFGKTKLYQVRLNPRRFCLMQSTCAKAALKNNQTVSLYRNNLVSIVRKSWALCQIVGSEKARLPP